MTFGGWLLMTMSIGFVLSLTFFCFRRVLSTPAPGEHLHAPLDIDTKDKER